MNKIQVLRNKLASEHKVECTPGEVENLYNLAKKLKRMSIMTETELEKIFNKKDLKHLAILATIKQMKSK